MQCELLQIFLCYTAALGFCEETVEMGQTTLQFLIRHSLA